MFATLFNKDNQMKITTLVLVIIVICVISCSKKRDDSEVKKFFELGKFGSESDVALLRKSALTGNWDYIATFHGMTSPTDMDICQATTAGLHQKYPNAEYSCSALN
jgi:hypothetical protein